MKLDEPFIRLPYVFNHEILLQEVNRISREDWQQHPGKHSGNYAIPLITVDGEMNDRFAGRMKPTRHLTVMPYTRQVIASFGEVVSRSRIMIIEGRQALPMHTDINYHWFSRVRIHIPIKTNPEVVFTSHNQMKHMPQGEAWLLDTWHSHQVVNNSDETRIHLVIDTSGSSRFWHTASESIRRSKDNSLHEITRSIDFNQDMQVNILTEQYNVPFVMSPGEIDGLVTDIVNDLVAGSKNDKADVDRFCQIARYFKADWRQLYSVFGPNQSGVENYQTLICNTTSAFNAIHSVLLLASNNANAVNTVNARVLLPAVNEDMARLFD